MLEIHIYEMASRNSIAGTWSVDGNRLMMTALIHGVSQAEVVDYEVSGSTLTMHDRRANITTKYLRPEAWEQARTEGSRRFEETRRAAGFIALSEGAMNWNAAVAWCQQQGGRLPRVNNSDSCNQRSLPNASIIDGFGNTGRPWAELGLPPASYWTGTVRSGGSNNSWAVTGRSGYVSHESQHQNSAFRVVCVPMSEADRRITPEARRAAAEKEFIALSDSLMNRADAAAYCQKQGGRLPLINNSVSWDGRNPPRANIFVEGFGDFGSPWPSRMPAGSYWTGTDPNTVTSRDGKVFGGVGIGDPRALLHVACVPATGEELRREEEERRTVEAHREEERRKAREARDAAFLAEVSHGPLPTGFIAIAPRYMTWVDAKAFCQQQGGRLPRINNSDSLSLDAARVAGTRIDGFGALGRPWVEVGLPGDSTYWAGTEGGDRPGTAWIIARDGSNNVHTNGRYRQDSLSGRAVCVP